MFPCLFSPTASNFLSCVNRGPTARTTSTAWSALRNLMDSSAALNTNTLKLYSFLERWAVTVYVSWFFCLLEKHLINHQMDFNQMLDVTLRLIVSWNHPNSRRPPELLAFKEHNNRSPKRQGGKNFSKSDQIFCFS